MIECNPNTLEAYKLLHEGTLALCHAEQAGLRIDMDYVEKKSKHLTRQIDRIENNFKESQFFKDWQRSSKVKVNIGSGPQLGKYLYEVKGIKPSKETEKGSGSTDDKALKQLNIPELNDLLEAKKLKKLRDTYLIGFTREQVDGYIHPFFNLNLAQTFRSSSDSPNFQNLPKRDKEAMKIVRSAIYARPGHGLMEADFSGIEVRSNACINQDTNLIKYILDPTSDMHRDMAQQIFKVEDFNKQIPGHAVLRQAAKNAFVFPEFYGSWYKNCAEGLVCTWGELPKTKWKKGMGIPLGKATLSDHLIAEGLPSYEQFTDHLKGIEDDFWHNRFKEYDAWKERWWRQYQKKGYFDLPTGFRCVGLMDRKQVCNYPGQGSAFHCLLWSFAQLDKVRIEEGWNTKLVGQIHDSIVLDYHPAELEHVKETIHRILTKELPEAFKWIIVPMEIEIEVNGVDKSWADKL